jgi:hypothetical protein
MWLVFNFFCGLKCDLIAETNEKLLNGFIQLIYSTPVLGQSVVLI